MANFKRGKCRRHCPRSIRGSEASWRARNGLPTHGDIWHATFKSPMRSYPAWWDRAFHVRPFRAASRRVTRSILKGRDADAALFPTWGKPHQYYW